SGTTAASWRTGSTRGASASAVCAGPTARSRSPPTRTTSSPWSPALTEVTTLVTVDAFTDRAFSGNPAAVCVLDEYPDDDWMQSVAREMNLSETAFLVARDDGDWNLRWFSPTVEVDICGHAT